MASWSGTSGIASYATKKQLLSSISGIYQDLQDISGFELQNVFVSTLTADKWISTPELYVSSIIGGGVQIQNQTLVISTGDFSLVNVSTVGFTGLDLGGVKFSFDLGLGNAVGGFLGGLGAIIGGVGIGLGTGVGLSIQGITNGLFSLANTRGNTYINSNVYETVNGTTQLQISTLGNAYPLYSSIFRSVSSISPDTVPGQEILLSSFFQPGTTCIRSVSDPLNPITNNSTINTSTIQSFGQWIPFLDATPTGDDIIARDAFFSTVTIGYDGQVDLPFQIALSNSIYPTIASQTYTTGTSNNINRPWNFVYPLQDLVYDIQPMWSNTTYHSTVMNFISSPYDQFQSTLTSQPPTYFITSSISTPALFTWSGAATGNFAVCEIDQTGFRSTATFDFAATSNDLIIQWGLAIDNRNSTIGAGTAKRVSWDNDANTSNFSEIPIPQSTLINAGLPMRFYIETNPYEVRFMTDGAEGQDTGLKINVSTMRVGGGFLNTSASNQPGYAFQFDGNTFVNGILEANTIIALSSIIAVSTTIQSLFSTVLLEANTGIVPQLAVSSISAINSNITIQDALYLQSSLTISSGNAAFELGVSNSNLILESYPAALQLLYATQSNVNIPNLSTTTLNASNIAVSGTLTAGTLVYSNAEAPYLTTSTITFGYTGNFSAPPPDYTLSQNVQTPVGLQYLSFAAASNQVLHMMNFSNTVVVNAQLFSTPLTYTDTFFGASNIQGWASTIFYNPSQVPLNVYLTPGAGDGMLALQASNAIINAYVNSTTPDPTFRTIVPFGSNYVFTTTSGSWATNCNAPPSGITTYNNNMKMWMDFETTNISTSDTLVLSAERINFNGITGFTNLQASNITANQITAATTPGYGFNATQAVVGNPFTVPSVFGLNVQNTISSTGNLNFRPILIPGRGFNLFNSYNVGEWNNTIYNIDSVPTVVPQIVVGEVIRTTPSFAPYSGRFWLNNTIDSTPNPTPVYINNQGVLTTLGIVTGGTFALIQTTNGTNWTFTSNVPNPQGITSNVISNFYQVQMNNQLVNLNAGMPLSYTCPSFVYNTNKVFFFSPQIRVATPDAPSFATRESGFESTSYFDSNIIFTFKGNAWESEALNVIVNYAGTSFYSVAGWMPQIYISRIRTSDLVVYGYDVQPVAYPVGGGATDFVWGSQRFIRVSATIPNPSGDMRENYLMIPKNYYNYTL